jgi:hypothetical protein
MGMRNLSLLGDRWCSGRSEPTAKPLKSVHAAHSISDSRPLWRPSGMLAPNVQPGLRFNCVDPEGD